MCSGSAGPEMVTVLTCQWDSGFIEPEETPGPMVVVGHADESIFIVEGRERIEPEAGEAIELTAGGSASIKWGAVGNLDRAGANRRVLRLLMNAQGAA